MNQAVLFITTYAFVFNLYPVYSPKDLCLCIYKYVCSRCKSVYNEVPSKRISWGREEAGTRVRLEGFTEQGTFRMGLNFMERARGILGEASSKGYVYYKSPGFGHLPVFWQLSVWAPFCLGNSFLSFAGRQSSLSSHWSTGQCLLLQALVVWAASFTVAVSLDHSMAWFGPWFLAGSRSGSQSGSFE